VLAASIRAEPAISDAVIERHATLSGLSRPMGRPLIYSRAIPPP
jgi:hypothetical protein